MGADDHTQRRGPDHDPSADEHPELGLLDEPYERRLERAGGWIWEVDLRGICTYASPAVTDLLGYSPDALLGRSPYDFMPSEEATRMRQHYEALVSRAEPIVGLVSRYLHQDGHEVILETNGRPFFDSAGALLGYRGISHDPSERARAAEAIRASEERFRSVVESTPLGMHFYRLEPDDRLVFTGANPAADRILGVDNRQFVGQTCEAAFPALTDSDLPGRYRAVARTGEADAFEQVIYADARIQRAFEVHAFHVGPNRMAALFEDITARKAADVEQLKLAEQLRQTQKMEALGRMAGGIAHDFNNLLTAISGNIELIRMDLPSRDPMRSMVSEIRHAANRATDLTRQLLAFSRQQPVRPRVIDLNESIDRATFMLERLLGETIKLDLICAEDIHPVQLDPGHLEQVLVNLAVNARDAMPDGGMLTLVTENATLDEAFCQRRPGLEPGPYVHLRVRDSGTGMEPEVLAQIFEPFFTTKPKDEGAGLGLSTVYGIVRQHGGCIEAQSEPGWGTTMEIYLPGAKGPAHPLEESRRADLKSRGETILLVEDEPVVRQVTRRVLKRLGYKVLTATQGAEALRVARDHEGPLDLLLTDVVMPFMKGPEVAQRLGELKPGLRVIYMSGYADDVLEAHGPNIEELDFLPKPFTPQALAETVRAVLDRDPEPA